MSANGLLQGVITAVVVFAKPPRSPVTHEPCVTYAIRNLLSAQSSLPFLMSPNNIRSGPHDPLSRFLFCFRPPPLLRKHRHVKEGTRECARYHGEETITCTVLSLTLLDFTVCFLKVGGYKSEAFRGLP
jgi:hypothetical protein